MNAEFTEKKIVITEVDGKKVITPAKVRKGMDALAFLGVTVIAGSGAFIVTSASESEGVISFGDGTTDLTYNPTTGDIAIAPANNGSGQTTEHGTT